uniref:uncharacterized protein LOC124001494 isoform X4 n=1 Tax=Oncorhynchus gorbuscha TaxID=8017 RepID=UPI001EAED672|nr:uncharacterized protein LOC124001494 isoform X4 [Oncorhynchus gorbuscha]
MCSALGFLSLPEQHGSGWIRYYGPMPACNVICESHRLCKGEKEGHFVRAFQRVSRVVEYLDRLRISMSSDFQHYSFRMPNIGFQNLPLNIYIVVFGTAIFVFILSLLFCCYLIRSLSLSLCSERLRLLVTEVKAPGAQGAVCIQTSYTEGKGQRAKFA